MQLIGGNETEFLAIEVIVVVLPPALVANGRDKQGMVAGLQRAGIVGLTSQMVRAVTIRSTNTIRAGAAVQAISIGLLP